MSHQPADSTQTKAALPPARLIANPVIARSRSQRGVEGWAVMAERYANGLIEARFFQRRVMVAKVCFVDSRYPARRQNRRTFLGNLCRCAMPEWDGQAELLVDEAAKAVGGVFASSRRTG